MMPRTLRFYFARRMALSALLIEVSLCIPVVMTSLFHNLPPAAVRSGLLLPALFGTLPTVLYIALPMAVGLAIALEFARMASEGMVAVLYSLRLSVWSICAPAALVATAAMGLGYWLSCEIAPAYIGQLHDVIYIVRNSLNHRMLEPAQFYTFDNGKRTLYFERWVSPDVVAGMFIHQFSADDKDEEIITARQTQFQRTATGVVMIMSHGSIQTRPTDGSSMRTANFDQYVMPIDMQGSGGLPKRNWRGVFELPLGEFLQERAADSQDPWRAAEWMSEATKRFGIPILALAHAFLGIGLILNVSNATGRSSAATLLTVLAIPVAHIAILIGAETLVLKNPHLVIVVALAIAAEFAAGIALLSAQNANFALARRTNAAVLRRRPA